MSERKAPALQHVKSSVVGQIDPQRGNADNAMLDGANVRAIVGNTGRHFAANPIVRPTPWIIAPHQHIAIAPSGDFIFVRNTEAVAPDAEPAKTALVTADVDVYSEPVGETENYRGILWAGTTVALVGPCKPEDWCQVRGADVPSGEGWVWGALAF